MKWCSGVALGNYRCSIVGLDLNRQWRSPSPRITPEVYALKQLAISYRDQLALYVDLHGHSRAFNTFSYGCPGDTVKRLHTKCPP